MIDLNTPCIDGPGERMRLGYVRIWIGGRRRVLAHVHAWELVNSPKPAGMELDHLCRNRWCRNAQHLELVTHAVNCQRASFAKLDRNRVEEIRRKHSMGASQRALGREFGISGVMVGKIVTGRSWA